MVSLSSVVVPSRNPRPQQLDLEPLGLLRVLLLQRDGPRRGVQLQTGNQRGGPRQRHVLQLPVPTCGCVKGEDWFDTE